LEVRALALRSKPHHSVSAVILFPARCAYFSGQIGGRYFADFELRME
jgi:hypothetical protein